MNSNIFFSVLNFHSLFSSDLVRFMFLSLCFANSAGVLLAFRDTSSMFNRRDSDLVDYAFDKTGTYRWK